MQHQNYIEVLGESVQDDIKKAYCSFNINMQLCAHAKLFRVTFTNCSACAADRSCPRMGMAMSLK
jgi:hypothetical protein